MHPYNYADFPPGTDDADFANFPKINNVGQHVPDGELIDAGDGSVVRLSDFWKKDALVIEFGSIT